MEDSIIFPSTFHTKSSNRNRDFKLCCFHNFSCRACQRIFSDLSQQRVLIIGAGEMAELALQNLKNQGVVDVMVTNRTYTNAENLAEKFAGTVIPIEQLEKRLCEADIIISSTGARHFVLTQSMVRKCLKNRRGKAMFFIDIAVPRDIEPEINELPGAYCYDIDDLQNVVQRNQDERIRQAEQADKILEDEIARVRDWFLTRSAVPTIRKIRNEFQHIGQAELDKTLLRLSHLSDKDRDLVTSLVHSIRKKSFTSPRLIENLVKRRRQVTAASSFVRCFSEKEGNNKYLDQKKTNQVGARSEILMKLRIATRESRLALWQANWVREKVLAKFPKLDVQLVPMTTEGDQRLDRSLADIGGKGLFIKELEQALLDHRADLAVHSMKDLTTEFPPSLELSVITERDDPNDALVSNKFSNLNKLPNGTVIGTSSLRRKSQLAHFYPNLMIKNLRGNLDTRLRKLDDGEYDAIILAVAGLKRLGLKERIAQVIPHSVMLPAIAQGAIGIETRFGDQDTLQWIQHLKHAMTERELRCERKFYRA